MSMSVSGNDYDASGSFKLTDFAINVFR